MIRLLLSLAICLPVLRAQSALEIVEPANSSTIRPGEHLVINVRTVSTYANLWLLADEALGTIQMLNAPPYRFSVQIPKDIGAGLYRLWAVADARATAMILNRSRSTSNRFGQSQPMALARRMMPPE